MTLGAELNLINASIQFQLDGNISSYEIGEQKIYRLPLKELRIMKSECEKKIIAYGADFDPVNSKPFHGRVNICFTE